MKQDCQRRSLHRQHLREMKELALLTSFQGRAFMIEEQLVQRCWGGIVFGRALIAPQQWGAMDSFVWLVFQHTSALLSYNSHSIQCTLLKCAIHWILVYSQSCATIITFNFRKFHHPQKKPLTLQQSLPFLQSSQPQATMNLFSISMNLPILNISCKQNHTTCGLLYLVSLSWASLMSQLVKNPPAVQETDLGSIPWLGRIPWRRERLLTPVFWPGEFHGIPWGHKESDMTK